MPESLRLVAGWMAEGQPLALNQWTICVLYYACYHVRMTSDTDMNAHAFFMADYAAVENGKVYSSGAFWDRLNFQTFPAVAHFAVVAVLNIPWRAYHQAHKFAVWFQDADGQRLAGELGGQFTVGTSPDMKVGDATIMPIAAMVNNFVLAKAGDYAAVLSIDGLEVDRWPFRVQQVFSGMQQGQPMQPSDVPDFG